MSTTRSVRPTDLVALVSFDGRVYLNEARTWERLGRKPEGPRLLGNAIEPWLSFATGRHTWISIQGQTIRGLISARQRSHRTVWEVECLIAASDDERIVLNLFDQVSAAAGQSGVHRVFLRLDAGSDLLVPARRAGFVPFREEALLRLDAEPGVRTAPQAAPEEIALRPRATADAFALYRLYNATAPEHIRRHEGATFQQWQAAGERRGAGRGRRELVAVRADEIVGHCCCCRAADLARVDLMARAEARAAAPALLDAALAHVGERRPLFSLLPSYAGWLRELLHDAGFQLDSEYIGLIKRTAIPLAEAPRVRVPAATHALAHVYSARQARSAARRIPFRSLGCGAEAPRACP